MFCVDLLKAVFFLTFCVFGSKTTMTHVKKPLAFSVTTHKNEVFWNRKVPKIKTHALKLLHLTRNTYVLVTVTKNRNQKTSEIVEKGPCILAWKSFSPLSVINPNCPQRTQHQPPRAQCPWWTTSDQKANQFLSDKNSPHVLGPTWNIPTQASACSWLTTGSHTPVSGHFHPVYLANSSNTFRTSLNTCNIPKTELSMKKLW